MAEPQPARRIVFTRGSVGDAARRPSSAPASSAAAAYAMSAPSFAMAAQPVQPQPTPPTSAPPVPPRPRPSAIGASSLGAAVAALSPSSSSGGLFAPDGLPPYAEAKRLLEQQEGQHEVDAAPSPHAAAGGGGGPVPRLRLSGVNTTAPPGGAALEDTSRADEHPDTVRRIHHALSAVGPLMQLEERTGISRVHLAVTAGLVLSFLSLTIFGVGFFTSVFAFIYPAWRSFKALERGVAGAVPLHAEGEPAPVGPSQEVITEQLHWLTYWVVYGIFHLLEVIIDAMFSWIYLYRIVKLAFLVWCFLPETKGSLWLFDKLIRPVLQHNEATIEVALAKLGRAASQVSREVREMSAEIVGAVFGSVLKGLTSIRLPEAPAAAAAAPGPAAAPRDSRKLY